MSIPTTWLIVGANRGIGLEFVRQLSAKPNTHVVATVRSLAFKDSYSALSQLQSAAAKSITILQLDTSSIPSIDAFVSSLVEKGIKKIDYSLNSAAINQQEQQNSLSLEGDALQDHIAINVIGPAKITSSLFSSKLLSSGSVVLNMSSGLGSLAQSRNMGFSDIGTKCTPYSISKAALNMLAIHQSSNLRKDGVIVVLMDPGWVKTDMGGPGAMLEPEESVAGMVKVLEGLTIADTGKFYTYTGKEVPW